MAAEKSNILIDIGHPAHFHLFKNLYGLLESKGKKVIITIKDDSSLEKLLDTANIPYINLGKKGMTILQKAGKQYGFNKKITRIIRENNIGIAIGVSVSIVHSKLFSGHVAVVLDDDDFEATPSFSLLSHTFADFVLVPDCTKSFNSFARSKYIKYPGYHELAYLHPSRFKPDPGVLDKLGVDKNQAFFILRFNKLAAHHDIGKRGIDEGMRKRLIKLLKLHGKVFISLEGESLLSLDGKYTIPHDEIHSAMYFATMLISDSQTMSSEAAVLGTPSLRLNSFVGKISYLEELEKKYGLTFGFLPGNFERLINKAEELLSREDLKKEWFTKRMEMLNEKIDVTAFIAWFIEQIETGNNNVFIGPAIYRKFAQ